MLKKYPNKRLDTEKSTYVTLHQVADMIKLGPRVEVIDAKNEEDVTAFILHQIILEGARMKNGFLPASLLHLIIQYGETVLKEFFDKYLQQTIENDLVYKKTFNDQFRQWLNLSMDLSDTAPKSMTGLLTPYKSLVDLFSGSPENKDTMKKGE